MMYSAPCTLSKFLKTWKTNEVKGIFCHGYFSKVEELEIVDFPPRSAFYDNIKRQDVDDDLYNSTKNLYESRLALPADHPDKFYNMKCFLKYYNLLGKISMIGY